MLHYQQSTGSYNLHELELNQSLMPQFTRHVGGADPEKQNGKVICLIDCDLHMQGLIKKYFTFPDTQLMTLNSHRSIMRIHPQLFMLGTDRFKMDEVLRRMESLRNRSGNADIPFIVLSNERLSAVQTDQLLESGVIDYINVTRDPAELMIQMKAASLHIRVLHQHKERLEQLWSEKERMVSHFADLKDEIQDKQRESLAHLELFMRSKKMNEALVDKIHDLRPFLNPQGKSKLSFLAKQMKWELDEEEELSLQRRHDESHVSLYRYLEERDVGLTKYEMRLCAYLKTNHTPANIARITLKSSNCINVAFARIRSKLGVGNNTELKKLLEN